MVVDICGIIQEARINLGVPMLKPCCHGTVTDWRESRHDLEKTFTVV